MNTPRQQRSNPGPRWGYSTIAFFHRWLPRPVFRGVLAIGVAIGLMCMPQQRRHSSAYLQQVLQRRIGWRDQWRHFFAFTEALVSKLTIAHAGLPRFCFSTAAHAEAFVELCRRPEPVLFGTFHVGYSDLMGCLLTDFQRNISLVRMQVGNSRDIEAMHAHFGDRVKFIWINHPDEFLFRLKDAMQQQESIALQCDRINAGGRTELFHFMGAERPFPFTIYRLSALFRVPVVFAFTGPHLHGQPIAVTTSKVFTPVGNKREVLAAARTHFQEVLQLLENHLQQHPYLWFNFLPLNATPNEPAQP